MGPFGPGPVEGPWPWPEKKTGSLRGGAPQEFSGVCGGGAKPPPLRRIGDGRLKALAHGPMGPGPYGPMGPGPYVGVD